MRLRSVSALVLSGGFAAPAILQGQGGIPFSQQGGVTQRVAFTDIAITYSRPTARGRLLFGDSGAVVRWGRVWHPGADSASMITLSRDVTFEGRPLKAGSYTFWTIPRAEGTWTLIVSAAAPVFHTPYPGEARDVLRVEIAPEKGSHMETLAYYFAVVARDSTVLRLHWGDTVLPMRIRVRTDP
jgi:hypothetical protein